MKRETGRAAAFDMPPTNPAFPAGPYRFVNREYFIIQYRTDPEALRRIVPEPLELTEPVVNYEFIRMPDSTGFWRLHRKRPDHPGAPANPSHSLNPQEWSNVNSFRFSTASTDSNDAEHQQSLSRLRAHLST